MTRGRTIWLALLAVGLLVSYLLRPSRPEATSASAPRASALASNAPQSDDEPAEFEIEVADPHEVDIAPGPLPAAPGSEGELNRKLASIWESEPARALALAEDGERRFGKSPRAVERRLYEIKALVKLGRIGSARTRAERYLADYPPGPMTDEVERLTGVHRRPE